MSVETYIRNLPNPQNRIIFNGTVLDDVIPGYRTIDVTGRDSFSAEINEGTMKLADGALYKNGRLVSREITVSFAIVTSVDDVDRTTGEVHRDAFRALKEILFPPEKEPVEITFFDETPRRQSTLFPMVYYKGIVTSLSVNKIIDQRSSQGQFVIHCSDPFKYGYVPRTYNANNDILSFSYNGNYRTYPRLKARMLSDNGYCTFINTNGALLQFGNPDELDGEKKTRSERLLYFADDALTQNNLDRFSKNNAKLMNFGGTQGDASESTGGGSFMVSSSGGKSYFVLKKACTFGTLWRGAGLRIPIGTDSTGSNSASNFTSHFSIMLGQSSGKEQGIVSICLTDSNNDVVAGITLIKNSQTNKIEVYSVTGTDAYKGRSGYSKHQTIDVGKFAWTGAAADIGISKVGEKFTFHTDSSFVIKDDTMKSKAVTHINLYFGALVQRSQNHFIDEDGHEGSSDLLEPYMIQCFRGLAFTKDNATYFSDIKNVFKNGDVLDVDVATGTVKLNNKERPDLGALGNDWENFYLVPAANRIECLNSLWATRPTYSITYNERYI